MPKLRHGVPAGWQWRDARPRWIPSPTLRKQGWKGGDLKDGRGQWMARGASIEAAEAIANAVKAWRAGQPVPAGMARFAPDGALAGGAPVSKAVDPFSIGALIDAYVTSDELLKKKDGTPRPKSTVDDYRRKLKRLVDAMAGYAALPDTPNDAYRTAVARVRAMSVFVLEPTEGPDGMIDPLRTAYWRLRDASGLHMAFGVLACASAWLSWCRLVKSRRIVNWAAELDRETPPGRIRAGTLDEVKALVAIGDANGYEDVVDAFVLSLDLSWSQIDVLQLTEDQITDYRCFTARQKTGRVGGTPLTFIGRDRLDKIRARRQGDDKVTPLRGLPVIQLKRERATTRTSADADGNLLRKRFAELRDLVAVKVPSITDLTFADARDTAVTWARSAGLSDDQLASRTLQSRKNIANLHDKHYGEIGPDVADAGLALLEASFKKRGIVL